MTPTEILERAHIGPLQLHTLGRSLQAAGFRWETWRGSLSDGSAVGWWKHPVGQERRGDPTQYDQATVTAARLYLE